MRKRLLIPSVRSVVLFLVCLLIATVSMATDFTVINGNNTGAGSLRQAILDANADAAVPHTITFTVSGVISITSSLPAITRQVTIDGGNTVTISGPGGNNTVALLVLGAGSNNSIIRNLTMQNTGTQPIQLSTASTGITLQNLVLTQTGTHYMNRGILASGAVTNLTIRNVAITGLEDNMQGIYFAGTVTNTTIDSFRISGGGGGSARGIHVQGVTNGLTIKNSIIDMDDPATTNDGDYGIYFVTTANNVTIDSTQFHDNEVNAVYCATTATNFKITNSLFDNLDGWIHSKFVYFLNNVNTVTIDKDTFNAKYRTGTDDGDYGIMMSGGTNQKVTITNSVFNDADTLGLFFGNGVGPNNHDNILIQGNTFSRNGNGSNATGGIDFIARNISSDAGSILITENTFANNNGNAILARPGNGTTYVIPNFTISKNTIYNTGSANGAIRLQYIDKVIITQNSIYNNQGLGILLFGAANCDYSAVKANTPQIISSAETTPGSGTYNLVVKMPAICGTGNCSIELFSNEAGVKGVGGQHYVTTVSGLKSGNNNVSNITGSFPEITAAPFGSWSATLRVNNNCGTSEFGNRMSIKPNGPAGISAGIALWLRGDDISVNNADPTATGQKITGWQEFSGGGGPSATTVVNNPLTKLNGINYNPVADMDGDVIRGILTGASSWITTPTVTTVAVFNPLAATPSGGRFFDLFSQSGTTDANTNFAQIEFYRTGNNINSYRGNTLLSPPIAGTTGVSALGKPGVFSSVTSATNHTTYYDGVNMGTGAYNKGSFKISQWFVGSGWNSTNGWSSFSNVDFAEVFTYNRVLTPVELQRVQSYMALKYGIAMKQSYLLSVGTTPVWDITANTTYSKEIAALVRDKASVLHQKQARAFQTDEVVAIGLGSALAATNNENSDSITNDLSVLMWGNDSASTSQDLAFTGGTKSNTRMHRVWKIQKTNWTDQDITIQLAGGQSNNYLLISTDPTFASVGQELPMSSSGSITLSSSLLTNGAYFTFGRQQRRPGGVGNGLTSWVKADEGVTLLGANAASWLDQAPAQRLWGKVGTFATTWLASSMNYNPAIQLPGGATGTSYFTSPIFTTAYTAGEVFSVQSSAVNAVSYPYELGGTSGTTGVNYRWTDNNMYTHFGTNVRKIVPFGTFNPALPLVLNINSGSNSWVASLNGKVALSTTGATNFSGQANVNSIGAGYGSIFNGPISEVILYNRKLTAAERQQVNTYMAVRYGITLDQTSPTDYLASDGVTTMWKASDNTGFAANIAGVARDDNGSLYQKQSRSINTAASGNLIAMAIGDDIAASNADNDDSITNDKSSLVWGDNAAAITYTTAVMGSNVTVRMPRVWKVDKSNWADQSITIKLFGSASNAYLLISNSNAAFTTIDQELPVNPDSTITINTSLLPDGAYFTFAKQIKGPGFVNTGVQFWLRADDGISAPAVWNDFSGNDNDAAQPTVASQPASLSVSVNFNPAFKFDGVDDFMDLKTNAGVTGTNPFTIVSVTKRNPVTTGDIILGSPTNATNGLAFFYNINKLAIGATNVNTISSTGTYTTPNTPYLASVTRAGNLFSLFTNGAVDGSGTQAYNFLANPLRVGTRGGGTADWFSGDYNEVAVYNRTLSADELQQVNSYMALKYGLTLNNGTSDYLATDGTTRMWTVSKNTGYVKNIAGIGRDDKTNLYQKQSRSSSDSTISIYAGTSVAPDNLSNGADMEDLSFFTWADNGSAPTFSAAVTSVTNATFRMARVWKVDRTNWSDQDLTVKIVPGGERYLLVNATDPTFGAGTVEYPIDVVNGTTTLNSANLPDGAFFTLGTKIVGPACVNNGIVAWLRADYAASPSNWVDFSGNQSNAAQATTGIQPGIDNKFFNFNPGLTFNGTTQYMAIPNAAIVGKFPFGAAARTVIGVGSANVVNTSFGMWLAYGADGLGTATYIGQASPVNSTAGFGGYNTAAYNVTGTVGSLPVNKSTIIGGRYDGTTAFLDVNGLLNGSLATAWNTNSTQNVFIGKGVPTTNQFWNGKTGELIVYNRQLTADELTRVNSYLALKYGITLDQTTPADYIASDGTTKMWTAADNTGFNRRITGIGRDDCPALYQKQSLSVDTGIVTMAIGDEIDSSNQANISTMDNDNSYFVFADDGGATLYNTPINGVQGLTTRMARTWKVDKTNWSDADISFRLKGGNTKVYMVISADATFDASDAAFQLDSTGFVSIASVNIPDGAYFTFAKAVNGPGFVNIGVQFWLRADDSVSTPDTWQDYSGNENNASQATVADQPAFVTTSANYQPAFLFNGTTDYMDFNTNAGITGTNPFTMVFVGSRTAINATDAILAQQGTTAGNMLAQYSAANNFAVGINGTGSVIGTATYAANIPYLTSATRSGNLFSFFRYGVADGTGTQPYSFLTTNLRLGNRAATADVPYGGNMNEVVIYNRALSAAELRQVHSYLSLKYGMTLTGDYMATDGTTTYWSAATNTGYLNNIAGIGRDDNTGLYQKQSRSINTAVRGNMVAIGLDSVVATNRTNTGVFTDDLSYMVWGDNGLDGTQTTEFPASLNPGGCSKITRLQREWKVQETGNVSAVQLLMYLTGLVNASTSASDLKLMIDDDGDFSNGGTTIIDATAYDAATQTANFGNVDFADGQYFTLITDLTNQAPGGVITNLYTWYRADKGVTTTTGVSTWADQSASTKDVAQGTAGAQPVYNNTANLINFNPDLGFDGTNDVLRNAAISHTAATNGEDIFAVVLPNNVAGTHDFLGLGTVASSQNSTEFRYSANQLAYGAGSPFARVFNPASTNGIVQLANGNRSNAGAANLLLNGTSVPAGSMPAMITLTDLNIGSRWYQAASDQFFNGRIAEVALYNRQLTDDERIKVASYLAIKYGITLPHNYVDPAGTVLWDATLNAGFGNNITGIGRDDCNGLHQKQSKSVNTAEALVTIGNGQEIFATNADNSNSMDNNTALLIGDDNGARTAWVFTNALPGRERIARTWRVQNTGPVGGVLIQVPAFSSTQTVKLPQERNGAVYLEVSSSTDLTAATEVPMTLNGDNWEANYNFNTGDYFTFATNDECASAEAELTTYNTSTAASTSKCYVDGWILFKDPVLAGKYIAGIYDPSALIDQARITVNISADAAFTDLGKANSAQGIRLMRRMLQIDCASCFDAVANPNPGFTVRMFYSPDEKAGAEGSETNNMQQLMTDNGLAAPDNFQWFKASGLTVPQVLSGLTPAGIPAGGQQWPDGFLPAGQVNGVDYVDFTSIDGFSTFGGAWLVNLASPLPVTWLDVQAIPAGNHAVTVKWGTATETNNAGFEVERSDDGSIFNSVAKVAGKGNSSVVSSYSANDNGVTPGHKYWYRIRQTDLDGRSTYSKIVSVQLPGETAAVRLLPNPVTTVLQVEVTVDRQQQVQLTITDVSGRVLDNRLSTAQAGKNIYNPTVTNYANGTYFVRVATADGTVVIKKFVVQKGL